MVGKLTTASSTRYIYALRDPITYMCIYVGTTLNPKDRLKDHLKNPYKTNFRIGLWLDFIKRPLILEILDFIGIDETNHKLVEYSWIQEMLKRKEPLVNVSKINPGQYYNRKHVV